MSVQTEAPPVPYIMTSKGVEVRQPDGDEGSRWYVDPKTGDLLASVTTAISACTSKPWLVAWGAKLAAETAVDEHELITTMLAPRLMDDELSPGKRVEAAKERRLGAIDYVKGAAKRRREAASERGTWVHDVVEALVLDQPIPELPEDVKPYVDQFIDWWCDFAPVPWMSEATIAHRGLGWAGTLDLACLLPSLGHSAVIDVKSGANLDVFMRIQLNTYGEAEVVFLPLGQEAPMPHTDRRYVLHLMVDGYKFIDVTDESGECYAQFLKMLDQLQWRDRQGKRLGTVVYPPLADGTQPSPLLEDIDGIPATSKLIAAGIERLDDLWVLSARELLMIPGVGPGAIRGMVDVCASWDRMIEGLVELVDELDAKEAEAAAKRLALAEKRDVAHRSGAHAARPIKGCAACERAAEPVVEVV